MGLVGKTVPMMISSASVPVGVTWVVGGTLGLADGERMVTCCTVIEFPRNGKPGNPGTWTLYSPTGRVLVSKTTENSGVPCSITVCRATSSVVSSSLKSTTSKGIPGGRFVVPVTTSGVPCARDVGVVITSS